MEYRGRIGLEEGKTCRVCGEGEEDTEHVLLRCGGTLRLRMEERITEMADLSRRPRACWRIWKWFRRKTTDC